MSDAWENLDPDDLEAEIERREAYELSPAGIAEQNRTLLRQRQEFRLAADAVTAAWRERPEVEAVALFGSVAVPPWKEVPRFRAYRRAGIALWHECKDLDLALWLSSTTGLGGLRKASTRALAELYQETGIGVASHQVDVFVLEPGTDGYLGRLCEFARCPKRKPKCLAPGCGAVAFLQQLDGFVFDPEALAPDRTVRLFDRRSGWLRKAAEAARPESEEDEDGAMA